jgi:putative ABC transport system ATP-binding protein
VRRNDGRQAELGVHVAQQLMERIGGPFVEVAGWLIGEQQGRLHDQRAGHCHALLLADEPTGDLDEGTADALHQLLRDMHAEFGLTAIIATHNPRLAAQCDRVLRLEGGALRPS